MSGAEKLGFYPEGQNPPETDIATPIKALIEANISVYKELISELLDLLENENCGMKEEAVKILSEKHMDYKTILEEIKIIKE